jgi:cell division protein FtsB
VSDDQVIFVQQELASSRGQLAAMSASRDMMSQQMALLQQELTISRQQVAAAGASRDALQQQSASLQQELTTSRQQVTDLSASRDALQQQLASLQQELTHVPCCFCRGCYPSTPACLASACQHIYKHRGTTTATTSSTGGYISSLGGTTATTPTPTDTSEVHTASATLPARRQSSPQPGQPVLLTPVPTVSTPLRHALLSADG